MKRLACFIAMALLVSACAMPVAKSSQRIPVTKKETQIFQQTIKSQLKDPFSVQFRNFRHERVTYSDGRTKDVFCGDYNAKNSFGAYTGFKTVAGTIVGPHFRIMSVGYCG